MSAAVHTYAGRAVGTAAHRDAKLLQPVRHAAEGACCSRSHLRGTHSFPAHDTGKILIGQLGKEFVQFRLFIIYISQGNALIAAAGRSFGPVFPNPGHKAYGAQGHSLLFHFQFQGIISLFRSLFIADSLRLQAEKRSHRRQRFLKLLCHLQLRLRKGAA